MPKNAPPLVGSEPEDVTLFGLRPLAVGYVAIVLITVLRLVLLGYSDADLFVDELQYWQWGQSLDWGYYSKPPLIGWVLRAVTELAGSDAPFWIRAHGALFHAATAIILMHTARRFAPDGAAAAVGVGFLTMPIMAVGAYLVSTDTILLPFFAGAIALYLSLVDRPSVPRAALMGAVIGAGMMGKYAAIYFWMCVALGLVFVPSYRISLREMLAALLGFAVVISPNVIWNIQNDLATVSHTADNVGWLGDKGVRLRFDRAAEFFAAQFLAMGPVFFATLLWVGARAMGSRQIADRLRWLAFMSLPIVLLVTVQGSLARAYANWAAMTYVAGILLVVPVLWDRARKWLWIGLGFNAVLALAVPVAFTQTTVLTAPDGRPVLRRFIGRDEASIRAITAAADHGLTTIVSGNRDMLAELFYLSKGTDITAYAEPVDGHPPHYYAQTFPYPSDQSAPFAFVDVKGGTPPCEPLAVLDQWQTGDDGFKFADIAVYKLPADCFDG